MVYPVNQSITARSVRKLPGGSVGDAVGVMVGETVGAYVGASVGASVGHKELSFNIVRSYQDDDRIGSPARIVPFGRLRKPVCVIENLLDGRRACTDSPTRHSLHPHLCLKATA